MATCLLAPAAIGVQRSPAAQLLINGDFEQLNGWFSETSDVNVGDWWVSTVGEFTPSTGFGTSAQGNAQGTYVVTDSVPGPGFQVVPHTVALFQSFVVPEQVESVMLSLDMFVNDWSGQSEFNANQTARVDIMSATANAFDVLQGVVYNAYIGTDGGPQPTPFANREFELLPFVEPGQEYLFRVYANATEGFLHVGVDNVSIEAIVPETIPTPATLLLCCLGGLTFVSRRRRHKSR